MKTKILYIYHAFAIYGGIERVLANRINELAKDEDFSITVLTTCQGEHPIPFAFAPGVRHIDWGIHFHRVYKYGLLRREYLKWQKERLFRKKLKEYFAQERPDIVVSIGQIYARDIRRTHGSIPWVVECHSDMEHITFNPMEFRMTLYRRMVRRQVFRDVCTSTMLVTLTRGDARTWRILHPSVRVIPNGLVLPPEPSESLREEVCKKVIFAGRFSIQKDIDALFSIWSMVHAKEPDWALHIYGDGEEKHRFLPLDGRENIHLHAASTEIFEKYRESSFLVLTSRYEPFGLVLIEAMSCGLPVVAFDCPNGPRDIITDGEDGFLIPPGNRALFAERILYLMARPEERLRMGMNARKKSESYSMERIAGQWKQLYREVAGKSRR